MQEHTYTNNNPEVKPLDPAPPKEKRYQFRSTARAWHSKYKRHFGKKQLTKAFTAEVKLISDEILIARITELYTILDNPTLHPTVDQARRLIVLSISITELNSRMEQPQTPNELPNPTDHSQTGELVADS